MNIAGFTNALVRVALSVLIITVQACGTTQRYQESSSESPRDDRQALLQVVASDRIGWAEGFRLLSVNGSDVVVPPSNEIPIPAGDVHLKLEARWSNEKLERFTFEFVAEAQATYKLGVFQSALVPKILLPKIEPQPDPPNSVLDGIGGGGGHVFAIGVITFPIWFPILLYKDLEKCPCPDCCFVWVEKTDGEMASGDKPSNVEIEKYERILSHRRDAAQDNSPTREQIALRNLSSANLADLCTAADNGSAEARIGLGRLYELGLRGLPRDKAYALFWYQFSGYLDVSDADLSTQFSHEMIAEAQHLMDTWQPGQCWATVEAQLQSDVD